MRKIQNRFPRLATGFFMPAVVLAFIVAIVVAIGIPVPPLTDAFGSLPGFIGLILAGWVLGGVQCAIYSSLMEFYVNPQVKSERLATIVSGLLILISTWTVSHGFPIVLLAIGFISGCVVGTLLRDMYQYYS